MDLEVSSEDEASRPKNCNCKKQCLHQRMMDIEVM